MLPWFYPQGYIISTCQLSAFHHTSLILGTWPENVYCAVRTSRSEACLGGAVVQEYYLPHWSHLCPCRQTFYITTSSLARWQRTQIVLIQANSSPSMVDLKVGNRLTLGWAGSWVESFTFVALYLLKYLLLTQLNFFIHLLLYSGSPYSVCMPSKERELLSPHCFIE